MKAEYAKIVDDVFRTLGGGSEIVGGMVLRVATEAAERCEALANKPVRDLTDEEITSVHLKSFPYDTVPLSRKILSSHRSMIAAHIAKQSEPDEIPFDQKKLDEGGWEMKVETDKTTFTFTEGVKVTLVRKT